MASSRSIGYLLSLLALNLISLFRCAVAARRLLSFVAIREFLLRTFFVLAGLRPTSLDLGHASVHLWAPASGRRGRKPALVLIHGFGGNSKWQWERQIWPLSRSFDLYIPDLLFFGGSRSDGPDRSVGYQARCVAEAMCHLGVARYSVVGISYGGFVAFRLAEGPAAEAVDRVAILTAGICLTPEQLRDLMRREERNVCEVLVPQKAEDLMTLVRRSMYRHPKWIPAFLLQDFIKLEYYGPLLNVNVAARKLSSHMDNWKFGTRHVMYRTQRKERIELLEQLLEKGIELDPLPVLSQDTLILWGDKDEIFPLPLAHQLQRHLGKKSRLEVIKDAGHALQLEKPAKVNEHIQNFLLGSQS